jgi:hypothetical protein
MHAMTHHTLTAGPLTTGEIARRCGVDRWMVLAAIKRGFLGEPARCGPFRSWSAADVDRVRAALEAGGYLPQHTKESS